MIRIALIVIYNHRYDQNIDKIENIYKSRFSNIFHLMPFYDGSKANVIPVYEKSIYFHGFIAQGHTHFVRPYLNHYLFIADDLVLNPAINETNYQEYFNIDENSSFLPHIIKLHEMKHYWPRIKEAFEYKLNIRGVEIKNELPNYDQAIKKLGQLGIMIKPLSPYQIYRLPGKSVKAWLRAIFYEKTKIISLMLGTLLNWEYKLTYPLIGSYSDIVVVSSNTINKFCQYCGAFAATDLHVEVALPTSLCLSAEIIKTEKDLKLHGKALWPDGWNRLHGENDLADGDLAELDQFNYTLNTLLDRFPKNYLYLHPIKLSKWNI